MSIRGLEIAIQTPRGELVAVRDVSLDLYPGESLCLVGESGCGKSLTALSILRLLPTPPIKIRSGTIEFQGRDLVSMDREGLRRIRGAHIGMVFQEPMTALNPVFTIGDQIAEAILVHASRGTRKRDVRSRVLDLLGQVGIPEPGRCYSSYPHQLSGGLRQRAMIAMALACNPEVLVADEPTTALDVTIQAQILDLLEELRQDRGLGLLLITHNLAVVAQVAQRVAIMYAGRIVEQAGVQELFDNPLHPYTQGLLDSVPYAPGGKAGRLRSIPGTVPRLGRFPEGCVFHPRCPSTMDVCRKAVPVLRAHPGGTRTVACHLYPA